METLDSLERLISRQLIEEISPVSQQQKETFDFTHDKIRQYVYDHTSLIRRRILHRRVAEVLERSVRLETDPGLAVNKIALYYQLAGESRPGS